MERISKLCSYHDGTTIRTAARVAECMLCRLTSRVCPERSSIQKPERPRLHSMAQESAGRGGESPVDLPLIALQGGINGVGIARDAAGRGGFRCFSPSGETWTRAQPRPRRHRSWCTADCAISSSVRFRLLVHESLAEREVLLAGAGCRISIRPMRFVLPVHVRVCADVARGCCGWAYFSTTTSAAANAFLLPALYAEAVTPVSPLCRRRFRSGGFEYSGLLGG